MNAYVRTASVVYRHPGGVLPHGLFLMVETCIDGLWKSILVRLDVEGT